MTAPITWISSRWNRISSTARGTEERLGVSILKSKFAGAGVESGGRSRPGSTAPGSPPGIWASAMSMPTSAAHNPYPNVEIIRRYLSCDDASLHRAGTSQFAKEIYTPLRHGGYCLPQPTKPHTDFRLLRFGDNKITSPLKRPACLIQALSLTHLPTAIAMPA